MKKLFLAVLVLLVCACNGQQKALNKLPNNAVILAFGDSLTHGTGASSKNDYPSVLAGLTHLEVINEGVPGEISTDGMKRLPALLDEYQPRLLILIHGGNDILRKIPEHDTASNLDSMIGEAKSRNIAVVMMGVPKPGLLFMESADIYQAIAQRNEVLIDLDTLPDILGDNELKSDLIHPNNAGYRQMATNIYNLLKDAGAL
jgi:lysophospholipase L1-like esterase